MVELIKVQDLKDHLIKEGRQRKWRQVINVTILPDEEGIPKEDRGKVLISYRLNGRCQQMVKPLDYEIPALPMPF